MEWYYKWYKTTVGSWIRPCLCTMGAKMTLDPWTFLLTSPNWTHSGKSQPKPPAMHTCRNRSWTLDTPNDPTPSRRDWTPENSQCALVSPLRLCPVFSQQQYVSAPNFFCRILCVLRPHPSPVKRIHWALSWMRLQSQWLGLGVKQLALVSWCVYLP